MLITSDSRSPHEHALAVLLEGRGPVPTVKRLAQPSGTRWQEHPSFGQRGGGQKGSDQPKRRQRQFHAVIGNDRVNISSDADERYKEAFTSRVNCLMAGMVEAYAL